MLFLCAHIAINQQYVHQLHWDPEVLWDQGDQEDPADKGHSIVSVLNYSKSAHSTTMTHDSYHRANITIFSFLSRRSRKPLMMRKTITIYYYTVQYITSIRVVNKVKNSPSLKMETVRWTFTTHSSNMTEHHSTNY